MGAHDRSEFMKIDQKLDRQLRSPEYGAPLKKPRLVVVVVAVVVVVVVVVLVISTCK